jgi:hypothetical protein
MWSYSWYLLGVKRFDFFGGVLCVVGGILSIHMDLSHGLVGTLFLSLSLSLSLSFPTLSPKKINWVSLVLCI